MSVIEDLERAMAARDYPQAANLAGKALRDGASDPALYNLAAFGRSEAGDYEGALELLHKGLELAPTDPFILYSIGFCLSRLERYDGALAAFDSALAVNPGAPAPLFQKGQILQRRGDEAGALACYDAAIAADPNFEDPLAGRAFLAADSGRFDEARAFAERALRVAPRQPIANMALARVELEAGRPQEVVRRLEPLRDDDTILDGDRAALFALLGDALDAVDRPDDAFDAWSRGKAIARQAYADLEPGISAREGFALIETFTAFAKTLAPQAPEPAETTLARGPRRHVFLLGFPRSGTTLLENILATHPDVVTLEEKPFLAPAVEALFSSKAAFETLLTASQAELQPFRDLYWSQVRGQGIEVAGKVFVDKMPLYSLLLPLIARLFPDAQILFAERDPRDVVFSCFRRAFKLNAGMYQFTSLENAAVYYDRVMTAAREYRRIFPLPTRPARYEFLVADFEGETRKLCDFPGSRVDHRTQPVRRARPRATHPYPERAAGAPWAL